MIPLQLTSADVNETHIEEVVEEEIQKYNKYTRKPKLQKPHFSVPNLSALRYPAGKEEEYKKAVADEIGDFYPALTDKGMCMVWNGETMSQTYKESDRVKDLTDSLDSRDSVIEKKIQGTGTRFRKTMWLDLGGR